MGNFPFFPADRFQHAAPSGANEEKAEGFDGSP
jgi:hypothetical protein